MNIHLSQQALNGHQDTRAPHAETGLRLEYQQDAASYIAALLAELRNLSGMAELGRLTQALDTAYYEAYSIAEQRRTLRAKPAAQQTAER